MGDSRTYRLITEITKEISESPLAESLTLGLNLADLVATVADIRGTLKDCVNELCEHCCRYQREHLGACDKCRWKKVRRGDYE